MACTCQNCGGKYKVDLLVPDHTWTKINGGHNLLCGFCIATGLEALGSYGALSLIDTDELTRLKRAESLIYVPGCWVCDKCHFMEVRSTLSMSNGVVAPDNSSWLDPCPNCNIPMRRQTEREAGNQACDRLEDVILKLREAELEIERLRAGGNHAEMDGSGTRSSSATVLQFPNRGSGARHGENALPSQPDGTPTGAEQEP